VFPHIVSQLGLVDWLVGATFANQSIPSVAGPIPATGIVSNKKYKDFLTKERNGLRERGYSNSQITDLVSSGAYLEDVTGLENQGYAKADIVNYLSQGVSPKVLQQYKEKGYEAAEIKKMVATSTKGSGSKPSGGTGSAGGGGGAGAAPDTLSIEIKFIIVTSGNVTPTWKLLRVSANTTGNLLSLGRTRTHDLIITIGPNNQQTLNTHLASQIGNAVSNGNQGRRSLGNRKTESRSDFCSPWVIKITNDYRPRLRWLIPPPSARSSPSAPARASDTAPYSSSDCERSARACLRRPPLRRRRRLPAPCR
jgi:hypothetical protein